MTRILQSRCSTARKQHICEWCGKAIEPGEKYFATAHIWEGDFYYHKAHRRCSRLAHAICEDYDDYSEGIDDSIFQEVVHQEFKVWGEGCLIENPTLSDKILWLCEKRRIRV